MHADGLRAVACGLAVLVLGPGCFAPSIGEGQYLCGSGSPACPAGFSCQQGQCLRGAADPGDGGTFDLPVDEAAGDLGGDAFDDLPPADLAGPDLPDGSATDPAPPDAVSDSGDAALDLGGDLGLDVPVVTEGFSSYTLIREPIAPFVDACALVDHREYPDGLDGDDDNVRGEDIGFSFTFYRLNVSTLTMSINGAVLLDPAAPDNDANPQHNGHCLPSSEAYPSVIGALRDDLLRRSTSQLCWSTQGTAPGRQFVATWKDLNFFFEDTDSDPGAHFTFTLVLNEADQSIEMLYQEVDGGTRGVNGVGVGVQNQDFTAATQLTCKDQPSEISAGLHVRFVPVP